MRRDGESCWKENAPQSMARGGMGPGKAERGEAGRSGAGRDGRTAPRGVERGRREWNSPPSTSIESTKFAIFDTGSLVSAKNSVFGVVELRLA